MASHSLILKCCAWTDQRGLPTATALAGLLLTACGADKAAIEPELMWPLDVACGQGSSRTFLADEHQSAIFTLDRDTGELRTLSKDATVGEGPLLWQPVGIDLFAAGDRAVVLSDKTPEEVGGANVVLEIDLSNGRRKLLADLTQMDGVEFKKPTDIRLTSQENQLLVTDVNEGVVAVDLETGRRRVLVESSATWPEAIVSDGVDGAWAVWSDSSATWLGPSGAGSVGRRLSLADPGFPADVAWLTSTKSLLLLAGGGDSRHGVWLIDPDTERENLVSGDMLGGGPSFGTPEVFCVDAARQQAIVIDPGAAKIFRVDLMTGNRNAIPMSWQAGF